jgi:EAL domain-containing protein (putative c-di-GMP-specific phosphodiesterase class I)
LKIDRSFVVAASASERDRTILESVTQLGARLSLHVVAEGVEDEATLALLLSIGCPTVQGYLFSKPLPAAEIEEWLRRHESTVRNAA